jgi:hypothetical protein
MSDPLNLPTHSKGKPVALKHMRMFQSTDQRDIRRVSGASHCTARL